MSVIKGLKNINALLDKPKYDSDKPRVRWLKLADAQSVKIRFIEELDDESANYNESRGLSLVVKEHTNPKDYRRKAVDTMDSEGRDWAEEMHRKDPKAGWRGRLRFYCNVLVDDGIEEPYAAIWSMGVSKMSSFNTIREYALETGSISNLTWKLKRNGQGTETSYTLIPSAPDSEPFAWGEVEPFNLELALTQIPYAEQEAFYLGFDTPSVTSATNVEW
tara:strand:- start:8 stop:664 length:657 start_codon:yes stop_codon:yes gene_type:complete